MCTLNFELVIFTHSCLAVDDQQFLTVLIKCGGSEKSRFSLVCGLGTLYRTSPGLGVGPCSCRKCGSIESGTHHFHLTPLYSVHSFPEQWIFSPVRLTHVKCTNGNLSFVKSSLTMMTSIDFARGWQATVLSTPCNDRSNCSR